MGALRPAKRTIADAGATVQSWHKPPRYPDLRQPLGDLPTPFTRRVTGDLGLIAHKLGWMPSASELDGLEVVRAHADALRTALETMPRAHWPTLSSFPQGACGDAAPILGQYFADAGLGDWYYVSGERWFNDHDETHAWIERDGVIVDITADQFPEVADRVLVTRDHRWHATFQQRDPSHCASTAMYDDDTNRRLQMMYKAAILHLVPPDRRHEPKSVGQY